MAVGLAGLFRGFLVHSWGGLELRPGWAGLITDRTLSGAGLSRCVGVEGRGWAHVGGVHMLKCSVWRLNTNMHSQVGFRC